jgi:hypothetical protein
LLTAGAVHRNVWPPILLIVGLAAGCSATTIVARVLDAETRQPVAGAVVLGVWNRLVCQLLCAHELVGVRETETDGEGRFTLERLPSSGYDGEGGGQAITVYKFGYVAWSNLYVFPSSRLRENQEIPGAILLERFPPGESRGKHVSFINNVIGGGFGDEAMPRFRQALERELTLR